MRNLRDGERILAVDIANNRTIWGKDAQYCHDGILVVEHFDGGRTVIASGQWYATRENTVGRFRANPDYAAAIDAIRVDDATPAVRFRCTNFFCMLPRMHKGPCSSTPAEDGKV